MNKFIIAILALLLVSSFAFRMHRRGGGDRAGDDTQGTGDDTQGAGDDTQGAGDDTQGGSCEGGEHHDEPEIPEAITAECGEPNFEEWDEDSTELEEWEICFYTFCQAYVGDESTETLEARIQEEEGDEAAGFCWYAFKHDDDAEEEMEHDCEDLLDKCAASAVRRIQFRGEGDDSDRPDPCTAYAEWCSEE